MAKLGQFIKKYRVENKLTLREFSAQCNLSHTYIDKLEKGRDSRSNKSIIPTIETLNKIAVGTNQNLYNFLLKCGYFDNIPCDVEEEWPNTSKLSVCKKIEFFDKIVQLLVKKKIIENEIQFSDSVEKIIITELENYLESITIIYSNHIKLLNQ